MSRKRTRESLAQQMHEPCGSCAGTGSVKTAESTCIEILRGILNHSRQQTDQVRCVDYLVRANQSVIDRLLEEDAQLLSSLADDIDRQVRLQVETCYAAGQYDLVCVPVSLPIQ